MFNFSIDLTDTLNEFNSLANRSEELKQSILLEIKDRFQFSLENKVNRELKSTRAEYLKAMSYQISENTLLIGLNPTENNLPLMIEDGCSAFDLKEGFSKSDKRKPSYRKNGTTGWYLTIPFRWATSEALGESPIFSNKMIKKVESEIKKQDGVIRAISRLPAEYQKIAQNATSGYQHKSPIIQGLKKNDTISTGNEKRSGYTTFRRVSDTSDEGSWIHSGFTAKDFMGKSWKDLEPQLDNLVSEIVDNFLQGK